MKNQKTFLILLSVFILFMGGVFFLYTKLGKQAAPEQFAVQETERTESGTEETEQKVPAPDFTVYDAGGKEVRLSDYIGKPIVLNFWASWCKPCRMEMPDFNEKYLELGEKIVFLMINMTDGSRETVESASALIEEEGYTFPVVYDTNFEAASAYGAYSLPTTFFIDAKGNVIAHAVGPIDTETLQKGIDMIE